MPFETVATLASELVHVAWFVTVEVVPVLYIAVTVSCFVVPRGIVLELADMLSVGTAWVVLLAPVPPPHPTSDMQSWIAARTISRLRLRVNDISSPEKSDGSIMVLIPIMGPSFLMHLIGQP
jgi:hypothetical protein